MGRAPCCDKAKVKKGPWSPDEDAMLKDYIQKYGTGGNWTALPQKAGLKRCGKSCRLRWLNYLRPNIKHGEFSEEEDRIICAHFAVLGSRWSIIAARLSGRTDNDIKNYWNTKLKKKVLAMKSSSQTKSPPFIYPYHIQSIQSQPLVSFLKDPITPNIYNYNQTSAPKKKSFFSTLGPPFPTPSSFSLSDNYNYNPSLNFHTQDQNFLGSIQFYSTLKDQNFLGFGTYDQGSTYSSSDGSCIQTSYEGGRKFNQDKDQMGFQGCLSDGLMLTYENYTGDENNYNINANYDQLSDEMANWCTFGQSQNLIDYYDIESCLFSVEEKKTEN